MYERDQQGRFTYKDPSEVLLRLLATDPGGEQRQATLNQTLRNIVQRRGNDLITSQVHESATQQGDADDFLRHITATTSINTRRDDLRAALDAAATTQNTEDGEPSLSDLLRQIAVGDITKEETE